MNRLVVISLWYPKDKLHKHWWCRCTRRVGELVTNIAKRLAPRHTKWAERGEESYSREVAAEDRRAELIEKMTSGLAAKTL